MYKILVVMVSILFIVSGCGVWETLTGPTEPDVKIEIHDNSGEVAVTITDETVDVSSDGNAGDSDVVATIGDTEGGCCDEEDTCYSLPSGTLRDCNGCVMGETCTFDPDDEGITE